jgi:hypothetical protein
LQQRAIDFHIGPDPIRVRRMLERPFGSVCWKEDTPDRAATPHWYNVSLPKLGASL